MRYDECVPENVRNRRQVGVKSEPVKKKKKRFGKKACLKVLRGDFCVYCKEAGRKIQMWNNDDFVLCSYANGNVKDHGAHWRCLGFTEVKPVVTLVLAMFFWIHGCLNFERKNNIW